MTKTVITIIEEQDDQLLRYSVLMIKLIMSNCKIIPPRVWPAVVAYPYSHDRLSTHRQAK